VSSTYATTGDTMNNEELTKLFEGVYATSIAKALLVEAEAKGRREALAYDPPIPAEIKGRVQAEWFWKGVLAMREQETP
jgi:hypothetical protein